MSFIGRVSEKPRLSRYRYNRNIRVDIISTLNKMRFMSVSWAVYQRTRIYFNNSKTSCGLSWGLRSSVIKWFLQLLFQLNPKNTLEGPYYGWPLMCLHGGGDYLKWCVINHNENCVFVETQTMMNDGILFYCNWLKAFTRRSAIFRKTRIL